MARVRPHLLIDGDIYAYKAAAAAEKSVTFDGVTYHKLANIDDACNIFARKMHEFKSHFHTEDITIAFSDSDNFRKRILPSYKSNRKDRERPTVLEQLKDTLSGAYDCMRRPNLEGDDVLGILATSRKIIPALNKIIISEDKDMQTVPCTFFEPEKDRLREVTYAGANKIHMVQTLTGDQTDGYKGCPGIGEKSAWRLLAEYESYRDMWQAVVKAYKKAGLKESDALTQARMARILRNYDYDYTKKAPILWDLTSERRYQA